jgi:hypothetical protein
VVYVAKGNVAGHEKAAALAAREHAGLRSTTTEGAT